MDSPRTNVTFGSSHSPSHVVGIGASAGGLEALERFFDNLPRETGMAFVIVQHLSPDFRSMMDELLARHTELPIRLVENGMPVEAGPRLSDPAQEGDDHLRRPPAAQRAGAASGADAADRRLLPVAGPGLRRARGGGRSLGRRQRRVARDPRRARSRRAGDRPGRRERAVRRDAADGAPTRAWPTGSSRRPTCRGSCWSSGGPLRRRRSEVPVSEAPAGNATVVEVYRMLQEEYGIDFTHYKPSTVTRRIERRLALARSADIDEYVRRLKSDRGELDVLYRDLLIGVTRFFRDEQAFQLLESRSSPSSWRASRATRRCALGRRLRDGRRGLFAGHLAART